MDMDAPAGIRACGVKSFSQEESWFAVDFYGAGRDSNPEGVWTVVDRGGLGPPTCPNLDSWFAKGLDDEINRLYPTKLDDRPTITPLVKYGIKELSEIIQSLGEFYQNRYCDHQS